MFTKVTVTQNNRVIVTRNDRFVRLLTPGVHRIFAPAMLRVAMEAHEVRSPLLKSKWAPFLMHNRPDLVAQHFVLVKTGSLDLAMISIDGTLYDVILPGRAVLLWKAAGKITVELVNIGADHDDPVFMFSEPELSPLPSNVDENEDDWVLETQEEP